MRMYPEITNHQLTLPQVAKTLRSMGLSTHAALMGLRYPSELSIWPDVILVVTDKTMQAFPIKIDPLTVQGMVSKMDVSAVVSETGFEVIGEVEGKDFRFSKGVLAGKGADYFSHAISPAYWEKFNASLHVLFERAVTVPYVYFRPLKKEEKHG